MKEYEQGEFEGCGIRIGEEIAYDSLGRKSHFKSFEHFISDDATGCHETRTVISVTSFHHNGVRKVVSFIESCYECEECPCGTWVYSDSTGATIKREQYEDCYDGNLDCL